MRKLIFITFTILGSLSTIFAQSTTEDMLNEITAIWPANACGHFSTVENNIPLYSIACSGDYTAKERKAFLDVIFKEGYQLRNENWKHGNRSGYYVYRTERARGTGDFAFFKLFFRDSRWLYPNVPGDGAQLLLYVREVTDIESLMAWQSLGVPIVFGLNIFNDNSPALAEKITEYGQAYLLSFPLEPKKANPQDGPYLEVETALDSQKLSELIDHRIAQYNDIRGFSYTMGSIFTENVFAMRQLLSHVRGRGIQFYFDPVSAGTAFETARLMSFQAYRSTNIIEAGLKSPKTYWDRAIAHSKKSGYSLVVLDGDAVKARDYIATQLRGKKLPPSAFLKLEELPVQPN